MSLLNGTAPYGFGEFDERQEAFWKLPLDWDYALQYLVQDHTNPRAYWTPIGVIDVADIKTVKERYDNTSTTSRIVKISRYLPKGQMYPAILRVEAFKRKQEEG